MFGRKATDRQDEATKRTAKEEQDYQSERALKVLALTIGAGCLGLLVYSINSPGVLKAVTCLGTGLMVAGAALLVGGLLGFLFGIPRRFQNVSVPTQRNENNPGNTTNLPQDPASSAWVPAETDYQANTNLEQISDWLTKILVGVGLTQVRAISTKMYEVAGGVAWALGATNGNRSFSLSLILYYLIIGFLLSYLWTRRYLPGIFRQADRRDPKIDRILGKVEKIEATTGVGIGKDPREDLREDAKKELSTMGDEIKPGPKPEDPWNGQFGGSTNNDRKLSATVSPLAGQSGLYSIHLTVSTTNTSKPLTGVVRFFLHPTFKDDKPIVKVGPNGVAELDLVAWGAFTVGALADGGQTKLELNLAELPSAPAEFRAR